VLRGFFLSSALNGQFIREIRVVLRVLHAKSALYRVFFMRPPLVPKSRHSEAFQTQNAAQIVDFFPLLLTAIDALPVTLHPSLPNALSSNPLLQKDERVMCGKIQNSISFLIS
jgi:hypothetical protein